MTKTTLQPSFNQLNNNLNTKMAFFLTGKPLFFLAIILFDSQCSFAQIQYVIVTPHYRTYNMWTHFINNAA